MSKHHVGDVVCLMCLCVCVCVSHSVLLDGGVVISQSDLRGGGAELGQAEDGQIFMVQAAVLHDQLLHLLHNRQHPGLTVISTVSWRGHNTTAALDQRVLKPSSSTFNINDKKAKTYCLISVWTQK